jgi:hypothetical protein
MVAITHFPKTRLAELAGRIGGISRSDALAEAKSQLDAMRPQADETIEASITALEAIVYGPAQGDGHSPEQMGEILCLCDQIVTLAGTFDYPALDKVTRSLCDVTDGLLRLKRGDAAPIQVHMRALRLVSPRAAVLGPEELEQMLSQLTRILTHYGFDRISDSADRVALEELAQNAAAGGGRVG